MSDLYVGVGGKARKVKKLYVGVNGIAREVKKLYVGVGGKAREVYSSFDPVTGILARANFFIAADQTPVVACTPASQNEETYEWGTALGRVNRDGTRIYSTTVRLTIKYDYIVMAKNAGFTTLRIHPYLNYKDTYQYSTGADIDGYVNGSSIFAQFVQRQNASYNANTDINLSSWISSHSGSDTISAAWYIEARNDYVFPDKAETYVEISWL